MSFVILADSSCDLSNELRQRFNIEYIKGHMTLPDGTERLTALEWDFTTPEEFYKELKNKKNYNPETGNPLYTTSPATTNEFKEEFIKYLEEEKDILCITISSGLSGTNAFAKKAAKELEEDYPERKIVVVDSLRYSTGYGLLCVRAAIERESGRNIEEVAKWVEENKYSCHQMGFLDDLSFVAIKGKISKTQAFMGHMMDVKLLAEFSHEGMPCIISKTKGDQGFYDFCIKYMEKTIINPEEQIIFIAQTERMDQALELKQIIEERFKPKEVIINYVFPQNSINIGPGLCAAYYLGKEISRDLSVEKEFCTQITNGK